MKWRNMNVQAIIFANAQGVLITTMIRSLLLWTILGNSEEIKKPQLTVDCKKDCSCKKSFPVQLLRGHYGDWPIIFKCPESTVWFNRLSVQPSIFSKAFEVFDTGIHCQFFVWELPLECQSTFILQFHGVYIGN